MRTTRLAAAPPAGGPVWLLSPQRLDPLGTLSAWPFSVLTFTAAVAYALISTALQWRSVSLPVLGVGAVLALLAGWVVLLWAIQPARSPVKSWPVAVALALGVVAAALEAASRLPNNRLLQDDFGPLALGLMLITLAPYRPAASILAFMVLAALPVGVVILAEAPYFGVHAPVAEYLVVGLVPLVALGAAGAAFSAAIVQSVKDWQRRVARNALADADEVRAGVARSVQQQQVTLLSREVLPFLLRVSSADAMSTADIETARELAHAVRGELVEELDRSWLDELVERQRRQRRCVPGVADAGRLAAGMGAEQRIGFAALVLGLCEADEVEDVAVAITRRSDHLVGVVVTARLETRTRTFRRSVRQYLSVVRVLFLGVRITWSKTDLAVHFDYAES